MQMRIVGQEAEVAEAVGRVGIMLKVVRASAPRRRRDGGGVAVYLEVELPDVPAAGPSPAEQAERELQRQERERRGR